MHQKFGFGEVMGLSEYLTGDIALSPQLMLKTSVKKLTLLPAGKTPDNPAEILASDKMAALIDELTARYDDRYIIIDAPPPLVVPDTYAIVKKIDGIVLVTNYRKTKLDLLDELVGEVGTDKIIGAVINRSRARSSGSYGYRRLRKYAKYNRPY
jgi:Mrp family chromosome partitioning ATPase